MKSIAIIPARGGSKRIPRKNIKPFLGKPIIAYSIETAINTRLFDEVMVSTDDPEIAQIAQEYGASLPFQRSEQNANDYATLADVLIEVIEEYKNKGIVFDTICCLLPTAPLVQVQDIKSAFELFTTSGVDSICPVVSFSYPIQRALDIDENGHLKMIWPENMSKRSQDLKPAYHDSGTFYWIKVSTLLEEKKLLSDNGGAVVVNELQVQDIDNETDWALAELKYKLLYKLS